MSIVRGMVQIARTLLVAVPLLVLVAAVFVDIGPDGSPRLTAFHLGLALADPFPRECLRDSLIAAAATAALCLLLGGILGHHIARWRFWGRGPLVAWAVAPLVLPPLVAAFGLRVLLDRTAVALDDAPVLALINAWGPTLVWVLAGALTGTPWVALAVADSLRRLGPASLDAARLVGLDRRRTWWVLIWPAVRPAAALATAGTFVRALADPGPPLLLGLRRTLPFQTISALSVDVDVDLTAPRAAFMASATLVLAAMGGKLLAWWGGPDSLADRATRPSSYAAGPRLALSTSLVLALFGAVGSLPIAGTALGLGVLSDGASVLAMPGDSLFLGAALDALLLAAVVGPVLLVLAWGQEEGPGPLARLAAASPLALAAGVALTPRFLAALVGPGAVPEDWARHLDARASGLALAWGTAACLVPFALGLARGPRRPRNGQRFAREEAALLAGQRGPRARRLGRPMGPRASALPLLIVLAAASASAVTPALVLDPGPERGPWSSAMLRQAETRGPGPRLAAMLGTMLAGTNLIALALAGQVQARGLSALAREGTPPGT